jgi:hypothetical protein
MADLIPKDNLEYAVLLSIDGGKSNGSGFRINYEGKNFLITAKHVLFSDDGNLRGKQLIVNCQSPDPSITEPIVFELDLLSANIYTSKENDVTAILIGKYVNLYKDDTPLKDLKQEIKRPKLLQGEEYLTPHSPVTKGISRIVSADIEATRGIDEIQIANDVYLMGYPTSLGLKRNTYFDYTKPLLRKGIIAGINKKQNTFIIDCAAYQGNSGGPIVEKGEDNLYRVIGIVSRYIPFETIWYSNRDQLTNTELSNSGYSVCVPMNAILDLLRNKK